MHDSFNELLLLTYFHKTGVGGGNCEDRGQIWQMNQLIVSELMAIQCIRVGKCFGKYIKIKENRTEGLGIYV